MPLHLGFQFSRDRGSESTDSSVAYLQGFLRLKNLFQRSTAIWCCRLPPEISVSENEGRRFLARWHRRFYYVGVGAWPSGHADRPAGHLEKADDNDNPEWPIIDYLVAILPKNPNLNGRPYLAVFVLTHPDKDHIQGFAELLKRVDIGKLWHTPRVFRDQSDQESLCDDAKAFRKEADRRRKAIADNPYNIKTGDRLRVIGHDDILLEPDYRQLPESCKSRPASIIREVAGEDLTGHFEAFIHARF